MSGPRNVAGDKAGTRAGSSGRANGEPDGEADGKADGSAGDKAVAIAGDRGDERADDRERPAQAAGGVRRGRRAGGEDTRAGILTAARNEFAAKGYDGSSLRGVARAAGVDPALVHHYFEGKPDLFVEAMQLPIRPADFVARALDGPTEEMGRRIATVFLTLWDTPATRDQFVAVLRSAVSHEDAARMMREFLSRELFGRLARRLDVPNPDVRAGLAASQMVGLALLRHIVRYAPIVEASSAELVELVAPTLQRYLTEGGGRASPPAASTGSPNRAT